MLEARDRNGRVGRAAVSVRVLPVRPTFLRLDAPRRLGVHARLLTIRVASSVLAPLFVRGGVVARRTFIGRGSRLVRISFKPGHRALKLLLTLGAGRLELKLPLIVARR
ncbi:MAG: hypothetical protein ACR2GZ_12430 [Solirubrobacteraceae bacterium]